MHHVSCSSLSSSATKLHWWPYSWLTNLATKHNIIQEENLFVLEAEKCLPELVPIPCDFPELLMTWPLRLGLASNSHKITVLTRDDTTNSLLVSNWQKEAHYDLSVDNYSLQYLWLWPSTRLELITTHWCFPQISQNPFFYLHKWMFKQIHSFFKRLF